MKTNRGEWRDCVCPICEKKLAKCKDIKKGQALLYDCDISGKFCVDRDVLKILLEDKWNHIKKNRKIISKSIREYIERYPDRETLEIVLEEKRSRKPNQITIEELAKQDYHTVE
jgi:hypothetical protein